MSIRDALTLKDWHGTYNDEPVVFRRPSALDLIEALEVNQKTPERLGAWMVARHLVEGGKPVFSSLEEALGGDAHVIAALSKLVEPLYAEGRD